MTRYEEEIRDRLKQMAKKRVAELLEKPQDFGANQRAGSNPPIHTNPYGGRHTIGETKDGRPYRRYL